MTSEHQMAPWVRSAGRGIGRARLRLEREINYAKETARDAHRKGMTKTEIADALGITSDMLDVWLDVGPELAEVEEP